MDGEVGPPWEPCRPRWADARADSTWQLAAAMEQVQEVLGFDQWELHGQAPAKKAPMPRIQGPRHT